MFKQKAANLTMQIMKKVTEINMSGRPTIVMFDMSGHVEKLYIRVFLDGWAPEAPSIQFEGHYGQNGYLEQETVIYELEQMLEQISFIRDNVMNNTIENIKEEFTC